MDKNAIKKFAISARRELIARVSQRAQRYGIEDKKPMDPNALSVGGHVLSPLEQQQRKNLIERIKASSYELVMEEAAYTWFNRFCALRYMEVNGYLPSRVRVFTNEENEFEPQILKEAINLDLPGLEMERVYAYKDADQNEELYRYLLITQCNALSKVLPGMFRRLADFTELLLPDNLLRESSVIHSLVTEIPQEDWQDQVQIIGWLYQYYNTEPKDKVFADLKKNIKITKEKIPAATQLFTPDWIVRYMVENSLGRLWVEGHPDAELQARWKYYLEEAPQEPQVQAQLSEIRRDYAKLTPEDIKVIDPCMGSGHILAYMFDVLLQIYRSTGYSERDAVASIVKNNLFGLDIDDRAAQLAYFSVMMKARQYDRRFFSRNIQPRVYAIQESNPISRSSLKFFGTGLPKKEREKAQTQLLGLLDTLHDAKEYGSILNVPPCDWPLLRSFLTLEDENFQLDMEAVNLQETQSRLMELVEIAETMAQKYHAVVTNPPYMGAGGMSAKLGDFVKKNYPDSKSDLSTVCMERAAAMCMRNGCWSMINIPVWMFLSTYETLRVKLLSSQLITSMIHPGRGIFGSDFGTTAFVFMNGLIPGYIGNYRRLFIEQGEVKSNEERECAFLERKGVFTTTQDSFAKIPGNSIAYWVNDTFSQLFEVGTKLEQYANARQGMKTLDNERFLRLWFEVSYSSSCFDAPTLEIASASKKKWFPINHGGEFRKYYGNNNYVVNWECDGKEIKELAIQKYGCVTRTVTNIPYYFQEGISWTVISSASTAFRRYPKGFLFSNSGQSIVPDNKKVDLDSLCALLNSKVTNYILKVLSPGMGFESGYIKMVPVLEHDDVHAKILTKDNIAMSAQDWDSFETSWDFARHPMVRPVSLISDAFAAWSAECDNRFSQLKSNEEELNRIFIDIYGLQDELTPEVADKDVTVRKADLQRDIRSLISYAVGCMFGRYSLDVPGLAYAGGDWSEQWVVVSGQYYLRKAVEDCVRKELSRAGCLAEVDGPCDRGVSAGEVPAKGGDLCTVGPAAKSGSVHSLQYCRGTATKLYQGISQLPVHCTGVQSGTGNPTYDLCSPEILNAIASGNSDELVRRGWKNAERVDWKSAHYTLTTNHFAPDEDNIIPICDDEYFEDDIVNRFVKFIEVVYGKDTLEENLRFIADSLGGKGQPREVIRNYFLNDFYADHLKTYQKRPIYWLFDSGKKNGFKALIYMHRYRPDTVARIRTDYVHEQQSRYRTAAEDLSRRINDAAGSERARLSKRLATLTAQSEELRTYEEKIHHLADRMLPIDLDDGVKVNYAKFEDVLAKIK